MDDWKMKILPVVRLERLNTTCVQYLFSCLLTNGHHVVKQLLPDKTGYQYNPRNRRHNLSLTVKTDARNLIGPHQSFIVNRLGPQTRPRQSEKTYYSTQNTVAVVY